MTRRRVGLVGGAIASVLVAMPLVNALLVAYTAFTYEHVSPWRAVALSATALLAWLVPVPALLVGAAAGTGPALVALGLASGAVGEDFAAVVGEPLESIVGADVRELETTVDVRAFEPAVSAIAGPEGDLVGRSVVLRDVTGRRTREQRLAVLNRVLRHNLRNELGVITGYSEMLVDDDADLGSEEASATIAERAGELVEIGDKARTIEEVMGRPPGADEETSLADVVERVVASVAGEYPAVSFRVEVPDGLAVDVNPAVLEPVLENLVENGAEHNDADRPTVAVRAVEAADGVAVTVVDNGPGIPAAERAVLESGDVTPLEHGSGLGLWVAQWGVRRLGGELSLAATEPRGTVATVRLPTSPQPIPAAIEGRSRAE